MKVFVKLPQLNRVCWTNIFPELQSIKIATQVLLFHKKELSKKGIFRVEGQENHLPTTNALYRS